jgi:hypothetical protein
MKMALKNTIAACILIALQVCPAVAAPAIEKSTKPVVKIDLTKIIGVLQQIKSRPNPKGETEAVVCNAADGMRISYKTSSKQGRPLVSLITVSAGGQSVPIATASLSSYLNDDDQIIMEAYRGQETTPFFYLKAELSRTLSPTVDQVATYSGEAALSLRGRSGSKVTCTVTRAGAGI